jgi:NAD(P)H-dependent FMN reductase
LKLARTSEHKFGVVRAQYRLRQLFVFLNMPAVLQPEVTSGDAAADTSMPRVSSRT